MRSVLFLLPACLPLAAADPQEPLRQAAEARLWIEIPEGSPPLEHLRLSLGRANLATWGNRDEDGPSRLTDVHFPIRWWQWRETTVSFTPRHDGTIDLTLSGPWAQDEHGKLLRQEILWDQLEATGTEIANPGFEGTDGSLPSAWTSPWAPYLAASAWPLAGTAALEGERVAATWHDRPLKQRLQVRAGEPVTLTFRARAATLPGFHAPRRLQGETPAHRANSRLKRGMNLGNCWEAPPPYSWGIRFTPEDIDRIAAEGFDHIRVPVAWHYHLTEGEEGYSISAELLADLEPVLRRALEKELHVIVNWHHFHDLTSDPDAHEARFVAGWEAISRHFREWPAEVFLELLNEPTDRLTTARANSLHAATIAAIRAIDPERILLVNPGEYADIREIERLHLPDEDERIIVSVHCYEPFFFTHQGASWAELQGLRGVRYPGPPSEPLALPENVENSGARSFVEQYNTYPARRNPSSSRALAELLDLARDWAEHFGRPIHLGEFGSHRVADPESRLRHARDVRILAEERGIPWTLWDWKAAFAYWDSREERPLLRAALFDD